MSKIELSDGGFVELVTQHGDDLLVVNAARASFDKQKTGLDEGDAKLIKYLIKNRHMAPFRHPQFTFRISTSEMVMRQAYKHQVGCSWTSGEYRDMSTVWSESSGRYTVYSEYSIPTNFRAQHETNKQGSIAGSTVNENDNARQIYGESIAHAHRAYEKLLKMGVCKEQARMLLPVAFMTTVVWTASLEAVANFIKLRDHEHAQVEIRELAVAIGNLVRPIVPISFAAMFDEGTATVG